MRKRKIAIIIGIIVIVLIGILLFVSKRVRMNVLSIRTIETKNCNKNPKLYFEGDVNIYTYCLDDIYISTLEKEWELKEYLKNTDKKSSETMENIIEKLDKEATFWDGGTSLYKDGGLKKYSNNGLSILKCNTVDKNKDIYIGISKMGYEEGFCE